MSPSEIIAGRKYCNRGAGTTVRQVMRIERGLKCPWYSSSPAPDEPVVEYSGKRGVERLYLSSFAQWCGSEVKE